jgi:hypothetical protein
MNITVKLNASLKKYAPDSGDDGDRGDCGNGVFSLDIPPMNIGGLIRRLGIPELNVGIVLVNGASCDRLTDISDGDYIQILTELMGG